MKTNVFFIVLLFILGSLITFDSCKKEEEAPPDPNVFCDDGLCAGNAALKQQCIDAFNTCMANNPDINDDECVATALLICNIK